MPTEDSSRGEHGKKRSQPFAGPTSLCSSLASGETPEATPTAALPVPGTVQRSDGDQVTVLFDDDGYRDRLVPIVVERGLLKRSPGVARDQLS